MPKSDRYTTLTATVESALDGVITGTAMKYDTPIPRGARLFEEVSSGAFRAQLKAPNRVAVLWQHDDNAPIGRATALADRDGFLTFAAKISQHEDIPEARKALALLDEGVIDEISVGFQWGTWIERVDDTGLTIVHQKAALREFSVVTFGALGREARVLTVASDLPGGLSVAAYRARLARLTS